MNKIRNEVLQRIIALYPDEVINMIVSYSNPEKRASLITELTKEKQIISTDVERIIKIGSLYCRTPEHYMRLNCSELPDFIINKIFGHDREYWENM